MVFQGLQEKEECHNQLQPLKKWTPTKTYRKMKLQEFQKIKIFFKLVNSTAPLRAIFVENPKLLEKHEFSIKGGYGKITEKLQKYHAKIIRKSCRSCRNHT